MKLSVGGVVRVYGRCAACVCVCDWTGRVTGRVWRVELVVAADRDETMVKPSKPSERIQTGPASGRDSSLQLALLPYVCVRTEIRSTCTDKDPYTSTRHTAHCTLHGSMAACDQLESVPVTKSSLSVQHWRCQNARSQFPGQGQGELDGLRHLLSSEERHVLRRWGKKKKKKQVARELMYSHCHRGSYAQNSDPTAHER